MLMFHSHLVQSQGKGVESLDEILAIVHFPINFRIMESDGNLCAKRNGMETVATVARRGLLAKCIKSKNIPVWTINNPAYTLEFARRRRPSPFPSGIYLN